MVERDTKVLEEHTVYISRAELDTLAFTCKSTRRYNPEDQYRSLLTVSVVTGCGPDDRVLIPGKDSSTRNTLRLIQRLIQPLSIL
jgi:hypothetical protein